MLSRVRGERVMADMVQDNLCCSRSVVDWPKVTRSLLGAVSFPVIGLLVPYGMSKQGIHDIFPYFFHRNRHCEPASLQGERQRYVIDAENGMLEFPGGGIKVQNWTSHFNPLYLFQEFMSSRRDTRNPPASKHEANGLRQWPFACERTKQDRTQRRFWRRFAFLPNQRKNGMSRIRHPKKQGGFLP